MLKPSNRGATGHREGRRRVLRAGLLLLAFALSLSVRGSVHAERGHDGHHDDDGHQDFVRIELGELLVGLAVDEGRDSAIVLGSRRSAFLVDLDDLSRVRVRLPHRPTTVAVDPLRRLALIGTLRHHSSILLLDLETRQVRPGGVALGRGVERLAVEPDIGRAVALDMTRRRLYLVDIDGQDVIRSLRTDEKVTDIAVHGGLGEAYVVLEERPGSKRGRRKHGGRQRGGELLVLDLDNLTERTRISLPGRPSRIVVDETLGRAVVGTHGGDRVNVVDLLSRSAVEIPFPGHGDILGLQRSSHLVVIGDRGGDEIGLLDLRSEGTLPRYARVHRPHRLAVSSGTNQALVIPLLRRYVQLVPLPGTAPRLRFLAPPNEGFSTSETPALELRWDDDDDDVLADSLVVQMNGADLAVDCVPVADGASCTPLDPLGQGTCEVVATVDDGAGHRSEPAHVRFTVDGVAPHISLLAPVDGLLTSQATVSFLGSLNEQAELFLDGQPVVVDPGLAFDHGPVSLVEGPNTYELAAEDPAGNRSVVVVTVSLDTVPPVVTAPPDVVVEASAVLTPVALGSATAVDAVSGALTPTADQLGPFPLGVTTVTWTAVDDAGNIGTASQQVAVRDTTPPVLSAPADVSVISSDPLAVDLGSPTATDLFLLDVTHDAPGLFSVGVTTVTWTAVDTSGNATTAEQQVSVQAPASGGGWGQPQLLEYFDEGHALDPRLSINARGEVMLVWRQDDGTRYDVWSRFWEPGTGWRDPELVEDIDEDADGVPAVALLPDGTAFSTWTLGPWNSEQGWGNLFDPDNGWAAPALIESSRGPIAHAGPDSDLALGANSRGEALAAWDRGGRIYASRYVPGPGWEAPVPVDGGSGKSPYVVVDEDGNATVLFVVYAPVFLDTRGDVWANRFEPGTGWLGPELVETVDTWDGYTLEASASALGLNLDASGNVFASWRMSGPTVRQVWANRWSAGSWGPAELIGEPDDAPLYMRLAAQADGRALVVVQGGFPPFGEQIRYSTFETSTGWSTWQLGEGFPPLEAPDGPSDIGTDGLGETLIVQQRQDGGEYFVEVRRHSFDGGWASVEEVAVMDAGFAELQAVLHPGGDAFVVWVLAPRLGHYDLYYSRFNASGDNERPNAFAGHDVEVLPGRVVTLSGQLSSDAEGSIVDFAWQQAAGTPMENPSGLGEAELSFTAPAAPPGTELHIELTVTDEGGASDTDRVVVTVLEPDTTPPVITPRADIVAEARDVLTTLFVHPGTAIDDIDGVLVPASDAPAVFPLGTTVVTWTATDSSGNTGTAQQLVTVRDTTPPLLTVPPDVDVESDVPLAVDVGQASATDIFEPVTITNDAPALFPLGTTVVTWTATDPNGNARTAEQTVTVGEAIDLVVTSPAPGAVVATSSVLVTGTLVAPSNTGVLADGKAALVQAGTDHSTFTASVALTEGLNVIEVAARTPAGSIERRVFDVTRLPGSDFRVTPTTDLGLAELTVGFAVTSPSGEVPTSIAADFDGDGSTDQTVGSLTDPLLHTYSTAGLFVARFDIVAPSGASTVLVPVQVISRNEVDALIRAVWEPLTARLTASDVEGALRFFSWEVRDRYRALLEDVEPGLPGLFSPPPDLLQIGLADGVAEYLIEVEDGGETYAVRIYFTRHLDGVWRVSAF